MSVRQITQLNSPRFLDAFDPNFEDRMRRWGSPVLVMSSSVMRCSDHRAWLAGSGGFAAARRQPALAVCLEAAVREGGVGRYQQGRRDPAVEARTGSGGRGVRHPKKVTAYFAKDSK
jgi:hypothetical protein